MIPEVAGHTHPSQVEKGKPESCQLMQISITNQEHCLPHSSDCVVYL